MGRNYRRDHEMRGLQKVKRNDQNVDKVYRKAEKAKKKTLKKKKMTREREGEKTNEYEGKRKKGRNLLWIP